jgi:hypothetical protein
VLFAVLGIAALLLIPSPPGFRRREELGAIGTPKQFQLRGEINGVLARIPESKTTDSGT